MLCWLQRHVLKRFVVCVNVEEELDDSPLQDLHETCQAAHASRKPTDKQAVSGWPTMEKSLQNLADEVQDAADADLFNKAIECQAPTADIPLAQMRLITKVQLTPVAAKFIQNFQATSTQVTHAVYCCHSLLCPWTG